MELKRGDVVRLKSGGPKMTVEDVSSDGDEVSCAWFNQDAQRGGLFRQEMLEGVDEED